VKTGKPIKVRLEFSEVSVNTVYADIYEGSKADNDTIYYNSISGWVNDTYPVLLDKTDSTYYSINESDTSHIVGVYKDYWEDDYVGVHVNPTEATTGKGRIIIDGL
jgi:hypothetical protein